MISIKFHLTIFLGYLMVFQYIVYAFPLATTWNEGKLHFMTYVDSHGNQDSLHYVKWSLYYERYAKKLALRCGDESEKIETLLDANIYTALMDGLDWINAYQEWEESEAHENTFPRRNLDTPAYVGCASETCGTQTYHVCTFNHYFLQRNPS